MDLFTLLVTLDLRGWTSQQPSDGPDSGNEELQRVLRKVSAIEREGVRYDFMGLEGYRPPFEAKASWRCIAHTEEVRTFLVVGAGSLLVVEATDETVRIVATSLASFFEHLLEPVAVSEALAQPLGELGFDGDGWGWSIDHISAPAVLAGLPDELLGQPLHLAMDCVWVGQRVLDVEPARSATEQEEVEHDPNLDELFGAGGGRPRPRTGLVVGLLFFGVLATVLGMACIAAPGGILVLLAWMVVEKDHDRVESGYLPEADRASVVRSRNLTHAGLVVVVSLFFVQAMLLCFGGYDLLLDEVYIPVWRGLVSGALGSGDTDLPL